MREITKITPAQAAQMPEWIAKWVAVGLSTEPADFEKAGAAALEMYKLAALCPPKVVLRMGSPFGAVLGGAYACALLRSQVRSQVGSRVGSQVRSQVESQVESQVGSQVGSQAAGNLYLGAFWASWPAYASYLRDVCGWRNSVLDRFALEESLTLNCGYVWWHEDVLVLADRPRSIRLDEQGRLHCEIGPSMLWSDGWALWHWHGVAVPAEWLESKSLTPAEALSWPNIEQRRAACEIVGWSRILNELKAKVIDTDPDPEIGQLVEVNLPDAGKERFLRVQCATGRMFALPVPPTVKTALSANAWTYDIPPDLMKTKEQRT